MTTRFAGSRSLDERRRRRLAGGGEDRETDTGECSTDGGSERFAPAAETAGNVDSAAESNAYAAAGGRTVGAGDSRLSRFPVRRLFSPKLWKHWAVSLFGLLVGAGILVGGWTTFAATPREIGLGPGFVYLFDLSTGRLARRFCELLLLLASQLALFIWWARSRSPRDFAGRYRLWAWCALFGFGAAFASAAELHVAWSKTALWLWDVPLWNGEILVWMIPAAVLAAWPLRTLHREMRDCSASLAMLWTAALCGLSAAALMLGVRLPLPVAERLLLQTGLVMSAHWALFVSLLLHARYVIHVTADPADVRSFPLKLSSLFRWPKVRRAAAGTTQTGRAPSQKESRKRKPDSRADSKSAAEESSGDKKKTNKSTTKKATKQKPAGDAAEHEPDDAQYDNRHEPDSALAAASDASEAVDRKPAAQSQSTGSNESVPDPASIPPEEPLDPEMLKGLSKRERRRLRKQRREAQRAERAHRRAG